MMASKNKSYASLFSGLSSTSGRKKPFLKTPLFRPSSFGFGLETFFLVQSFSRRTCCFGFSGKLRFPLWSNYLESSVTKYPGRAFVRKSARKLRHVVRNEKLFFGAILIFLKQNKIFSRLGLGNGRSRIIAVAGIFSYLRLSFCGAKFFDLKTFANAPSSPGFDS